MKILLALILIPALLLPDWQLDFEKARQTAQSEHKLIVLNFSGSDWCGPCIRLHKSVFDTPEFESYAKEKLVLVNADFPRLKKNALTAEQQKKNDLLAETYNQKGIFPFTLLLNAEGKVLKTWEGEAAKTPEDFINQIQPYINATN